LRITVGDDFVVKSETKEDFVEKEGGDSFSGSSLFRRAENHPLAKTMVDHDQQRVKAIGGWKIGDKVA